MQFKTSEDADYAREELNGYLLDGRHLHINYGKTISKENLKLPPTEAKRPLLPIVFPQDCKVRALVDYVARLVAQEGFVLEEVLRHQVRGNPAFEFLSANNSQLYQYYKWRVLVCAQGENEEHWREEPFVVTPEGPLWVPPMN